MACDQQPCLQRLAQVSHSVTAALAVTCTPHSDLPERVLSAHRCSRHFQGELSQVGSRIDDLRQSLDMYETGMAVHVSRVQADVLQALQDSGSRTSHPHPQGCASREHQVDVCTGAGVLAGAGSTQGWSCTVRACRCW